MKVIFKDEKEFKEFKKEHCPVDLDMQVACGERDGLLKCKECWKRALKNRPDRVEITVKGVGAI